MLVYRHIPKQNLKPLDRDSIMKVIRGINVVEYPTSDLARRVQRAIELIESLALEVNYLRETVNMRDDELIKQGEKQ